MKKLNVAFMGTGHIADKVAETVKQIPEINLYAVGSRSQEKADAFAAKHGFKKAYGSYESMLSDSEVELVYIATPHGVHEENLMECLNSGKNILCEKSFTLNEKQAESVLDNAAEKGLYVAEAIWCRYSPMALTIKDFIKSGKLGKINTITANLGYNVWERERVHKLELGGGALLDVGIYCLNFADLIDPSDIVSIDVDAEIDSKEKTDKYENIFLKLKSGVNVNLYSSLTGRTDRYGYVYGSEGYLVIDNINNYSRLRAYDNISDSEPYLDIKAPQMISGYEYEFLEAKRCIESGLTQSPMATWDQTLRLMSRMDSIRKKMGVVYPQDLN